MYLLYARDYAESFIYTTSFNITIPILHDLRLMWLSNVTQIISGKIKI